MYVKLQKTSKSQRGEIKEVKTKKEKNQEKFEEKSKITIKKEIIIRMASRNNKRGKNKRQERKYKHSGMGGTLLPRRFAAWVLEVSLVAASAIIPYGIGVYTEAIWEKERSRLDPFLAKTQEIVAETLALPKPWETKPQVSPLTNIFWYGAMVTPVVLVGSQIYLLGKTGQTLPKRWLRVRVVTSNGEAPGILRAGIREGVGRWGLPIGGAYLLWRYFVGFPELGILWLLSSLLLIVESKMLLFDSRRRTIHDLIAGTMVVNGNKRFAAGASMEQEKNDGKTEAGKTIIVTPDRAKTPFNPWLWMRQNPAITLLMVVFGSVGAVLLTYVGTQIYIQSKADERQLKQDQNAMYLSLVSQLRATATDPVAERKSVILGLAKLDDPRAVTLLVDLLGEEKNSDVMATLQQGIIGVGPRALPHLQGLNQSLWNELKSTQATDYDHELLWRLGMVNEAIANLLTVHSGNLQDTSLRRTHLGRLMGEKSMFTLVLNSVDLSGVNFRGAVLQGASLRGSIFSRAGNDGKLGTFDDTISDFSGADLQQADLTNAVLSHVSLERTNLIEVNFYGTNLAFAQLKESNLTLANLTNANLENANLEATNLQNVVAMGANFSGANMSQSHLFKAKLIQANLNQVNLKNANLISAQLKGVSLQNANLENANLQYANLTEADLRGANLTGADFLGVKFAISQSTNLESSPFEVSFANIKDVDFREVKNLSLSQIDFICRHGGIHPLCKFH